MSGKNQYEERFEAVCQDLRGSAARPRLLLHVCCAPCSSAVLERLDAQFDLTLFYFNPNITPEEEYRHRLAELERFLPASGRDGVPVEAPTYEPELFLKSVRGYEELPEGGERCRICYEMRLRRTAEAARDGGFDWFTTTLSVSPYKHADWLNEIGTALGEEFGVPYLVSDFKKKGGYQRSIELSKEYGLYRQNYCGCVFSRSQSEHRRTGE